MKVKSWFIQYNILLFFVIASFFPTLRILIIGTQSSDSVLQFIFSATPEILFSVLLVYYLMQVKKMQALRLNLIDWLFVAYILYNIIAGIWIAADLKVSIYAIRMTYVPMALYFVFSLNFIRKNEIEVIIDQIFKWFTFVALLGLILYFVFPQLQLYFLKLTCGEVQKYFIVRMTSIFWTPVVFGSFVSVSILYFSYRFFVDKSKTNLKYLIVLFICLFLTVSRGSIIVLIFGIILLGVVKREWKILMYLFGLELLIFIAISFYVSNPIDFFNWILESSSDTVSLTEGVTRVELWQKAFHSSMENPFGLGLGKAGHVASRFFVETNLAVSVESTDGWFLKLMNETGLIALFFYVVINLILCIQVVRYLIKNPFGIMGFLFVVFVTVNIQNLVSNVLDFYLYSYLYWLLVGSMVFYLKNQTKNG